MSEIKSTTTSSSTTNDTDASSCYLEYSQKTKLKKMHITRDVVNHMKLVYSSRFLNACERTIYTYYYWKSISKSGYKNHINIKIRANFNNIKKIVYFNSGKTQLTIFNIGKTQMAIIKNIRNTWMAIFNFGNTRLDIFNNRKV